MVNVVYIFSTVGDILGHCGDVQYLGGYHSNCCVYLGYCGVILSTVGDISVSLRDVQYHGGYRTPHLSYSVPWGGMMEDVQYPTFIMILSMVLNTPDSTQDIPHATQDNIIGIYSLPRPSPPPPPPWY